MVFVSLSSFIVINLFTQGIDAPVLLHSASESLSVSSRIAAASTAGRISSCADSEFRVERTLFEESCDASASFVLLISVENAKDGNVPYVVEKQMAQLIFRRRNIPEEVSIALRRGAKTINRDDHHSIFQVGLKS